MSVNTDISDISSNVASCPSLTEAARSPPPASTSTGHPLPRSLALPAPRARITEIRDNLNVRIDEAEYEGWLGEIEGLKISLAGANDKLARIDRRARNQPVDLGIP